MAFSAQPPRINFTARDYPTNLEAIKGLIQQRAPDSWTSFFAGDLGSVLVEVMAYEATLQSYTLDLQAQECFIDTLTNRQSLLHFCRLTGYTLRRATAVSLQVYARASAPPAESDVNYIIPKGAQVRSKDGQIWEVADDFMISPGNFTPVTLEREYGDISGRNLNENGEASSINALIKLVPGSAVAVLCQPDGTRWPSDVNFGPTISQGSILKLLNEQTSQSNNVSTGFGPAPGFDRDEYAIIEIGKYPYDIYDHTVLYLDRPWAGGSNFVGKWKIENRNILLIQGETRRDVFRFESGTDLRNLTVRPLYYPVLAGSSESFIPSGFFGRGAALDLGITVLVNQQLWQPTSSLQFEKPDSNAYEVIFDELDRMIITFGDGLFGALPQENPDGGTVVEVTYRVGGGASGNLPQNSIDTTLTAAVAQQPSSPVTVYLTNPWTVGNGGRDRETIVEAKRSIPQFVRTNDRAVTVEDYAFLATNFVDRQAGRAKLAKGVLHQNVVPREQNVVWVYVWVEGANGQLAPPTYTLKNRMLDYMNERKMVTDEVVIVDGPATIAPISLRMRLSKQANRAETNYAVQAAINAVFVTLRPGETLYLSRLYDAVQDVEGVDFVDFYWPKLNLVPANEFELYVNSLQLPQRAKLLAPATKGSLTVQVSAPTIFATKGTLGLFQLNRTPTTAIIDSVIGSVVTLRTALLDDYDPATCHLVNSDYLVYSWQYERPVNLYIRYTSGSGTSTTVLAAMRARLAEYFREVIRPEETLVRGTLEDLLRAIPDVQDIVLNLGALDSPTEQITPSTNEIVVMGVLSINGATQ